jgi:hypothetical protein
MEEYIEKLLDVALFYNLKELEFWDMSIGEVNRYIQSQEKIRKIETQERASYDYIHANLVIRGISIVLGSKESFPTIDEAYPKLFDDVKAEQQAKIEERKMELSALRFKQFAQSYNNNRKHKEVLTSNE